MAKAKRFGRLVFLFGDESVRPHSLDQGFANRVIEELMRHSYDPDFDYVAASGDMVAVVLMVAVAAQGWDVVNVLCFDHRDGQRQFKCVRMTKELVTVVS